MHLLPAPPFRYGSFYGSGHSVTIVTVHDGEDVPDREVQTIKARGMSLAGAFVLGFGSHSTAPHPCLR